MSQNGASDKLLWFFGGLAAGAALGLLFTPHSGPEIRRRIGSRTSEGREALSGSGRDMFERGRELYERGRDIVDEAAEMFERGRKLMEEAPGAEL